MSQLDTLDLVVLIALLFGSIAYFTKGIYWAVPKDKLQNSLAATSNLQKTGQSKDFVQKMKDSGKNCIVFYGSQTGTAEDYASRLSKEAHSRFGLNSMVADIEDYDFENLDCFPEDKIAFFILATYGEGEPTDNAVEFFEFISGDDTSFSNGNEDAPLSKLKYVAFGLGNSTYEHYNTMVKKVDEALGKFGATRIGDAGEGDDGAGTMEEDFLKWKETMWTSLTKNMSLEEREAVYEPILSIEEREDIDPTDESVYLGEPNKNHLEAFAKGPYNANNPYIAPIVESREIFTTKDRNCLHMEIDISGTNLKYTTGDHIAIWPTNSGTEIDRFLQILGIESKRDMVINVKGLDVTAKVPFPSPTTYDAIVRYHLAINGPVSRQLLSQIATFAPNEEAKKQMTELGSDVQYFQSQVVDWNLNFAQLLQMVSKGVTWNSIPFTFIIESLKKIQPRYYSISSSSKVQKDKVSITAVVESIEIENGPYILKGVATNHLLSLKLKQEGHQNSDPHELRYELSGPRKNYDGIRIPVHLRHTNFKLPSDPSKPVIMVGPGTGVAPFRGFVQERAAQKLSGVPVGRTILFFGCRRKSEDFLYEKEWEQYQKDLGDSFQMHVGFSRDGPKKVYVQQLMKENGKEIASLLDRNQKGYFYVCGDAANMAREVNVVLGQIFAEHRQISESQGEQEVKAMRVANRYQEDVWS